MLRIRLSRVGKKKQPAYRIVVTDQRNPREGAHLEIVGHYNPLTDPATLSLKEERLVHWLQVGAQPSSTAAKILTKAGVMEKAGRQPVVYEGKEVPPGAEKEKAEAEAAVAAAPAATAVAEPPAEAEAAAEPESAAQPEAAADTEATEPEAEAAAEPEAEPEAAAEDEPAGDEPDAAAEPEAESAADEPAE